MNTTFWNALARKKTHDEGEESKLNRVLNLFDLTALGVGSTLGMGVYILAGSVAYEQAGPAVVISFLFAAIASAFAGLCYAEFAARVPKAGSAYVYSYVTVGEFVAFTIGWNLILEYVIGASSVARGLSGYFDSLIENRMGNFWLQIFTVRISFLAEYPDPISFAIVAVLTIVLATGVKESSFVQNSFTTINMLTVIVVIVAGSIKANPSNWFIAKESIPEGVRGGEGGFMPYQLAGVMAGAARCFYGYIGFDCVATAGEEAKNAKRNIPLAIIFTLTISVIVYMAISTVITMMWPYYDLYPEAALNKIFQDVGWNEIRWIVSIGALFALFSSLLGSLFSMPRILYAMAADGVIFRFMSRVNTRTKTPVMATLISGFFSATMAAIFSLHQLVDMLSIGTLLAYTIVAISVLVLRFEFNGNKSGISVWREIMTFKSSDEPSAASSTISKLSIVIFCLLSIMMACLLTFLKITMINIILIAVTGGLMLLTIFIIHLQPIDKTIRISFKVPLVPLLPCLSIFCNIYLMLQLDAATWIRFVIWLIVGYLIYFVYGIRASTENRKISSI